MVADYIYTKMTEPKYGVKCMGEFTFKATMLQMSLVKCFIILDL